MLCMGIWLPQGGGFSHSRNVPIPWMLDGPRNVEISPCEGASVSSSSLYSSEPTRAQEIAGNQEGVASRTRDSIVSALILTRLAVLQMLSIIVRHVSRSVECRSRVLS